MKILITERQKNLLTETMSAALRRRLSPENIKDHIDSIVNYDIDVCEWEDVGECISDVGDMVVQSIEFDMLEFAIQPFALPSLETYPSVEY